ncbi:MAG: hypothetical protein ACYDHP_03080 [Ferrimicrobium sp.]
MSKRMRWFMVGAVVGGVGTRRMAGSLGRLASVSALGGGRRLLGDLRAALRAGIEGGSLGRYSGRIVEAAVRERGEM